MPLRSLASNVLDAAGSYDTSCIRSWRNSARSRTSSGVPRTRTLHVRIADSLHTSRPGSTLTIPPHAHHLMIDEPGASRR